MRVLCSLIVALLAPVRAQVNVLTVNYDNSRTNSNRNESILDASNVNRKQFGKLYSMHVDGQVYAQPLVITGVDIPGQGSRDLVIVATMHNSLYAFDAQASSSPAPLWKTSLGPTVETADYSADYYFTDVNPEVGILSTPVIDPATNTIYVVSANQSGGLYSHNLHAIDAATGKVLTGPVSIQAHVPGTGEGNVDGVLSFDSFIHLQRPGLLLLNGAVYVAFGSHGDQGVFYGWIMGYSAADITQQVAVFNANPAGYSGAIWMSGHGMAADENGAIYAETGNGDLDGERNFGNAFIKLDGENGLAVLDWFGPENWRRLDEFDIDLGSTSPVLIPGTDFLIGGGKEGVLYVLRQSDLGKLTMGNTGVVDMYRAVRSGIFNLALWKRSDDALVFVQGWSDPLRAYRVVDGKLDRTPASQTNEEFIYPYGGMTVTSRSEDDPSAILWVTSTTGGTSGTAWPSILHAYDANDLTHEFWNSELDPYDRPSSFSKFVAPTVANGRVYLPTFSGQVVVYGLRSEANRTADIDILNAFSQFGLTVSPGELLTIKGLGIGPKGSIQYQPDVNGQLPTQLGGVTVLFDGQPAAVVSASADTVTVVVPYSVMGSETTTVEVRYQDRASGPRILAVEAAHPGLQTEDESGAGPGAFLNEDGTSNSPPNPAMVGSVVSILATGLGVTNPPSDFVEMSADESVDPRPVQEVTATIDGKFAPVVGFSPVSGSPGSTFRVWIQVPAELEPDDKHACTISIGGKTSPAVSISVGRPE